ncbi:CBS domain-containing protein [Rapidithrix thailandica]|uniref:CBS domain-containing protein n=1 Tax=Rapidithrix thailandica TaxID=413964 RepID=A0AAW9RQ79_9BACT
MNFTPNFENVKATKPKGQKFDSVTKYMADGDDLVVFHPEQSIEEAMMLLLGKNMSGGPVLDDHGILVGMLSERDCMRIILETPYHNYPPAKGKVSEYMSREVVTVSSENDIFDVANLFMNTHYRRFPVLDQGRVIGQVSIKDVMRAISDIKSTTW